MKDHYQPIKDRFTAQEAAVELCLKSEREAMLEGHRVEKLLREKRDAMSELEDTLDQPRQELDNAKLQETGRKNKIETLRREIDVSASHFVGGATKMCFFVRVFIF